ncbi:MAG: YncE family protein [Acidobacteria bacterium]|nr:YncE family protein [Acidobacteriota bacterium]
MNRRSTFVVVALGMLVAGLGHRISSAPLANEKIYVAVEGGGKIVVLDAGERTVTKEVDLSVERAGRAVSFAPHDIQAAPDGGTVWLTANVATHPHGSPGQEQDPDEVIVIDPTTDRILKRIALGAGLRLAHVVVTADGAFAYVTAQEPSIIYKIDARSYEVVKEIKTREGCEPHGLRMAPDGLAAYVALLEGKALGILDLRNDTLAEIPLKGQAVETGVTPDGLYAFASLYDTKQLAIYHVDHNVVVYVTLPADARGPAQLYPTPDSRFVYLADQGYDLDRPAGEVLYKINLRTSRVTMAIKAGVAPHGVVVSKDGKFVYVTNMVSDDVSVIDTTTDQEVSRIAVGMEPTGICIWAAPPGGTP